METDRLHPFARPLLSQDLAFHDRIEVEGRNGSSLFGVDNRGPGKDQKRKKKETRYQMHP
jgi:hypothetical protein